MSEEEGGAVFFFSIGGTRKRAGRVTSTLRFKSNGGPIPCEFGALWRGGSARFLQSWNEKQPLVGLLDLICGLFLWLRPNSEAHRGLQRIATTH